MVDPQDMTRRKTIAEGTPFSDLLVPIFRKGVCVYESPRLEDIRRRAGEQQVALHTGIKRFKNPHEYPVGLESNLYELKTRLILEARNRNTSRP